MWNICFFPCIFCFSGISVGAGRSPSARHAAGTRRLPLPYVLTT